MNNRNKCKTLVVLIALVIASTAHAAVITGVARRGGSTNPAPALGGTLVDGSLAWVDRNAHVLKAIPDILLNKAEYVKTSIVDRDRADFLLDITLSADADVYLMIDCRVGDGVNSNPPLLTSKMTWVAQMGFVDTGLKISIDENNNGSIDNYLQLYKASFPAGTITLKEQNDGTTRAMYIVGAVLSVPLAKNPDPANGQELVPLNKILSWQAPSNPNIDPDYEIKYRVYMDPNQTKVNTGTGCFYSRDFDAIASFDPSPDMDFNKTYYWRVDSRLRLIGQTDPNDYKGAIWSFKSIPASPVADAGSNIVTSLDILPAMITGTITDADNNLASASWLLLTDDAAYPANPVKEVMNMQNRSAYKADPNQTNLLQDWIGSDTRVQGDPLTLTISGLPAGIYAWKSYHHDTQDQTGQFDMTIYDAAGKQAILNIDITNGVDVAFVDVAKVDAVIQSDGINPVKLVFDQHPYTVNSNAFFVMNGFDLVQSENALKIDFSTSAPSPLQENYEAYRTANEVWADFAAKSYSAFGTTVTINPDWGADVNASVVNTTIDPAAPTAAFTTDAVGIFKVKLTGTDTLNGSGSDIMEIRVYADACAAAKANPNGYTAPQYDFDGNCKEELNDFVLLAAKWLEDASLDTQALFTGAVTYESIIQP